MKINNRKNTEIAVYVLSLILLFDMACLVFAKKIHGIDHTILYTCLSVVFVTVVWRIMTLKYFSIEISGHIISVKYGHPFSKTFNIPALEIPLEKVSSCKLEKGLLNSFLVINVHTKKGIRSFNYRLGILSGKQADNFKKMLNVLKNRLSNEAGL